MASCLDGLNEAQFTAVTSPSDVVQILAPPGSGKTKTLTSRVAYLLQHSRYKPWDVMCLTFTIKSSREMRERLAKLIGNGIEKRLILGTFHSVCRRYLVTYGHLIGVKKGFGIADSSDTLSIIKRIAKRLACTLDPRKAQSRISASKSKGNGYSDLVRDRSKKNVEQQEFEMVFEAYEDHLAIANLLDYDDLLLRCAELLRQYPTCVSNVEVVLIDEFQDTNLVQFDLMRLFASKRNRVTTVGDPDQSIYGWRSAEIKNLGRMQILYPDTLVIHLKENYRSSGAVLLAAHEVIQQDKSRPPKPLLPTHCPGTVPVLRRLVSAEIEAQWIVTEIQRTMALTGQLLGYTDYAVLLRQASLSRHIELAMGRAGIPYRMVGGQKFYDRVEVKIMLDYLRVVVQPDNNDALSRVLNVPARGVGLSTAQALLEVAEAKKTSLWIHIRAVVQGFGGSKVKTSKAAFRGLGSMIDIIISMRNKIINNPQTFSPGELLRHLTKKLDFQGYIKKSHPEDHESRWANVEELVAQAADYSVKEDHVSAENDDSLPQITDVERQPGNPAEEALSRFLANVALATELQREDEDEEQGAKSEQTRVTISTIHAAKGLEWPVVFIPSVYVGMIPHSRAEDTDEERRLLYVAMTRAQALLYMSCPVKDSQRNETTPSHFLATKQVNQYLVNKGPNIHSGTVNDICQILNRGHPDPTQIMEASMTLPSQHDDLWPVKGEEDQDAAKTRWSKWDDGGSYGRITKRGRDDQDHGCQSENRDTRPFGTTSTFGATTTMQSSAGFTCSGFVSATSQLQQAEIQGDTKVKAKKTKASTGNLIHGPRNDLGSLSSFWNKPSKPPALRQSSMEVQSNAYLHPAMFTTNHDRSQRHQLPTASGLTHVEISNDSELSLPRGPLSTIPQNLSSHRLPRLCKVSRPKSIDSGDDPPKRPYSFISSSPPQSERVQEEVVESLDSNIAGDFRLIDSIRSGSDTKPASTFHATSIIQAQTASISGRKTLGVRRSVNGWAARANQGVSRPKPSGRK